MFWRSIILALAALVHFASPAYTAVVTVYKTSDGLAGSLRQAIQDASPGDTIIFHIPTTEAGYDPNSGNFTIGLTSGELVVNKNLTIDAAGQKITIHRSASAFRIFVVQAGTLTLSGLTISNGLEASCGGIYNADGLVVRNCTFVNNQAQVTVGGAICNAFDGARLQVSNCTFIGNTAAEYGSAIHNGSFTTTSIDNSTISANSAAGSAGSGAAVFNEASGTARVRNTIIVGNTSSAASKDVSGAFISEGYNLIGTSTGSTGFGSTGDQIGATAAQANLSSLHDNGGPTLTLRPLPGSVAIDQGKRGLDASNQPINNDQRGLPRPVEFAAIPNAVGGDGSDIGAVEVGPLQTGPTFVVTNRDDRNTADDGCTSDDCTLVEAVTAANANADTNTITFATGVGPVIANAFLANGILITAPVNIIGPGARQLAISGGNTWRIFNLSAQNVAISGLRLTNGHALPGDGGAIHNSGSLTLTDCAVQSSSAINSGAAGGNGGGLYNASGATAVFNGCTFSGNSATQFGGGAVFNAGTLTATNCTFTGNTAPAGGGILSLSNNVTTLRNCTITNNTATDTSASTSGGGGYYGQGGLGNTLHHFANTILAGNINSPNPDLRGYGTSEGNNLIGVNHPDSGFSDGVNGDKVGVSPGLNSLANNGGPTDTCSLLGTSMAINMGNNALALTTDQRGFGRSGVSDIGAFEFNGTAPPPVPIVGVVSSKVHGAQTFGINLPLSGSPGVECRTGGANGDFTIVFTFVNTLTLVGNVSVTSGAATIVPFAGINGGDAHQYVVQLTGVVNAQAVTLQLTNVNDSLGNNTPVLQLSAAFLFGDTTGNGSVNASDISQTKSKSGQALSASNFRTDVTVNNSINASDVAAAKSKSGTALPPAAARMNYDSSTRQ